MSRLVDVTAFLRGAALLERVAAAGIVAAALLLVATFPQEGRTPLPGLGPSDAMAICDPDPRATGYLTANGNYNSGGSGPSIIDSSTGDINSATVYAYLSALEGTNDGGSSGDKNCGNPVYRYGGVLWLTNSTTARINWGAWTANGNSSACYPLYGSNDYMHANWGTACSWSPGGSPGINYRVLSISLSPANLEYRNDASLNDAGDFEFVWDSCSTFYQDSANTGKVVKTGIPKSDLDNVVGDTTAISWKPGANCGGALTQDGTGTAQSFWYDTTAPTLNSVSNNAGTNSYASSSIATTIWVRGTTSGSITLTPAGTDADSGVKNYTYAAMAGTTTGWSPTGAVTQTGPRTYSWTSSVTDLQSSTIGVTVKDNAGNSSSSTTITLRGDDANPTWSGITQPSAPVTQTASSYNFQWAAATDAGAGLSNYEYVRQSVAMTGSNCGTPFVDIDSVPYPTQTGTTFNFTGMTAGTAGTCYRMGVRPVDRVGNKAASFTYSQPIKVVPQPTLAVTDNTASLTNAYRIGNTIYFGSASAGSLQLTATGTDAVLGIKSNTFGALTGTPTGWSPTTVQTGLTNPYSVTYSWTAGAASTSTSVTSRNNADVDSAATVITLTADGSVPTWSGITQPSAPVTQTGSSYSFQWATATDSGAGLRNYEYVRQSVAVSGGNCGTPFVDIDSAPYPTQTGTTFNFTGMTGGNCYRLGVRPVDRVGNKAALFTYSPSIKIGDPPAPPTLAVTDNTASLTNAYRIGSTIYFGSAGAGSLQLTATGTDAVLGIKSNTFGALTGTPTGWSPTTVQTGLTNPYSVTYGWTSGAASTSTSVTSRNNADVDSAATVITLTADGSAPTFSFRSPNAGGLTGTTKSAFTVKFTATDGNGGSGFVGAGGWSLQRQIAPATGGTGCGTFANDTATESLITAQTDATDQTDQQSLQIDYCYRWVLSGTDAVGNNSTVTSGPIYVVPFNAMYCNATVAVSECWSDTSLGGNGKSFVVYNGDLLRLHYRSEPTTACYSSNAFIENDSYVIPGTIWSSHGSYDGGGANELCDGNAHAGTLDKYVDSGNCANSCVWRLRSGGGFCWTCSGPGVHLWIEVLSPGPNRPPDTPSQYQVTAQPDASIGEAVWVNVSLYDDAGQPTVDEEYNGTVCLSGSAGSGAVFPDGNCATLSMASNMAGHAFRVLFGNVGEFTVTATGTGIAAGTTDVSVTDSSITATAAATAYVGIPMQFMVAAHRADNRLLPTYNGLVTFDSSDAGATFGGGINSSRQARMPCSCDDGRPFVVTFSATGTKTVTVTDEFGKSDQVQVNVLPAPAAIPVPSGLEAYSVEWNKGRTIDYYVKNTSGLNLTAIETWSTCGGWDPQRNSPNQPLTDAYMSFSVQIGTAECGYAGSQGNDFNGIVVVDDQGHKWAMGTTRYYRFSSVPGNSNFTMLDAGDPLAADDVTPVARTGLTTPEPAPDGGGQYYHVAWDGLTLRFNPYEAFRIVGYSFPEAPFVTHYAIPQAFQGQTVVAGTSNVILDDIPWNCRAGGPYSNTNISIRYADTTTGRDGRRDYFAGDPGFGPGGLCNYPNGGHTDGPVTSEKSGDFLSFDLDALSANVFRSIESFVGDPVEVFSGSQTADVTDFDLGGLTPTLSLTRHYRSVHADMLYRGKEGAHARPLLFGAGWTTILDSNLEFPVATRAKVRTEHGYYRFDQLTNGNWAANTNTTDELSQIAGGWKLTHRDGSGLRFDTNGRLAAIFDTNGRELVLTWTSGQLDSFSDATSPVRTADVTTNANGQITRIDLPGGRYVAYTYDIDGYLRTARDLAGTVLTYDVDLRGRITSVKNASGQTLLASRYDSTGRVLVQTDALGHSTYFSYDDRAVRASGWVMPDTNILTRTTVSPRAGVSVACYTTSGLMLGGVDAEDGIRSWAYDDDGNPVRTRDELGFVTIADYDAHHQPTSLTDALGDVSTMSWDGFGHPATQTGPAGTATVTFDPVTHLPLTITNSDATHSLEVAEYTYVAGTNLLETVTAQGGAVTTYHYDAKGYVDSVIDPEGRKTTFVTDPLTGLVTSSVGPLGNAPGGVPGDHTTTYTYDDAGRVLTITDQLGNASGGVPADHRTTYTYDSMGRLKTESRASGALTTYNYDLAGQLTSVVVKLTGSADATTTYEYDKDGNQKAVVDAENRRTETTYDLAGRPVTIKDPANKISTIEYDAKGRATATVDATGVRIETTYDALDRVTSVTDGAGKVTTYDYDPTNGLLATVTDPLNHPTDYDYDWLGRPTSVTNAENETSSITYTAKGFVESVTNARNKTTSFTYNAVGQLLTVTEPGNAGDFVTTYTYDAGGRLETRENDRGAIETYEYDALGRPTKLTDAVSKIWRTFYTNDGDIDHTIDGKGQTTTFGYDLAGRLLTTSPTAPTPQITYTYDETGRLLSMADGNGTTTYGYDTVGRLQTVTRGGRTTTYGYEDAGRLASVLYPGGQGTVSYDYDTAGRLETISDWATRLTTYHYDNASRVSSVERPGGLTTDYTYDDVDRPLSALSTRSGNTVLSQAWTYDPNGNIATLTDDTGTGSFSYDNLDRLLTASYPGGQSYSYSYDAVGNITQAITPAGTTNYTYDVGDRITSTGPGGTPTPGSSTRSPSSNNAGWTNSANGYAADNTYATAVPAKNGTTSVRVGTFGFDSQIPAGATITNVTVSVEWKVDITTSIATLGSQVYVGGVARGTELVNTAEPTSDTIQTYTVSGLTRADLLDGTFEVQVRASRGNSNTVLTASLDAVTVTVDYTTGGGAGTAPVYDDNGNMTSDGTYGNRTYAYDTLGRLTSVAAGGSTTSYSLDGAGNRWSQTTGAVTTAFDLDLLAPNPTILGDGTAKYLPGMPNAGYQAGGTWHNALTDLTGSPVLYVDTAGATSGLTHYDPYGAPRPGSSASVGIGFAGEYRDATGLVHLRARSYDPLLGRFTGRDTFAGVASAPQTGNRYAYAVANPLRFTDPSGHFVQSIIANPGEALSTLVSFTAIPGLAHAGISAVLGFDPISGRVLSAEERTFLGVAVMAIPGARAIKAILGRAWGVIRESALAQRVTAFLGRAPATTGGRILFGQRSVSRIFTTAEEGSTFKYAGWKVADVASGLRSGAISPADVPIQFVARDGQRIAINNRSLLAFRRAGIEPTHTIDMTGAAWAEARISQRLAEMGGSPSSVIRVRGAGTSASYLDPLEW